MELVETVFGPVQKYGTGAINVVFAHGSGIGMNHDFMQSFATAMSIKDFTVYLFEFGYMQQIQKILRLINFFYVINNLFYKNLLV